MKTTVRKEIPLIILAVLPVFYLGYIWKELPQKVPLHWNIKGEIDRYGDKSELLLIILIPAFVYLLLTIVPAIDPKNKLNKMGNKLHTLKLILIGFTSILMLFITYTVKHESLGNPNNILMLIGVVFLILGNYFQTIKANYFIGIKTPWTLENEEVWEDTHLLGGRLWFIGGIMIVISSLIFSTQLNFIIFFIITAILVIIPIVYSYIRYKELDDQV